MIGAGRWVPKWESQLPIWDPVGPPERVPSRRRDFSSDACLRRACMAVAGEGARERCRGWCPRVMPGVSETAARRTGHGLGNHFAHQRPPAGRRSPICGSACSEPDAFTLTRLAATDRRRWRRGQLASRSTTGAGASWRPPSGSAGRRAGRRSPCQRGTSARPPPWGRSAWHLDRFIHRDLGALRSRSRTNAGALGLSRSRGPVTRPEGGAPRGGFSYCWTLPRDPRAAPPAPASRRRPGGRSRGSRASAC